MGQDPDETLREIDAIRDRIDGELDALGAALPPTEEIVRKLAIGLAAGLATVLGLWYLGHRISRARTDRRVKRLVREALREALREHHSA